MAVTDKEYAILSNAVYRDENYLDPANYGFEEIDSCSIDKNGTYAVAYKNKDNEVVLAFRGTDNKLNILHDAQYCNNGETPPEFKDALQFYKDVKKNCNNGVYGTEKLSIVGMTGHSLGGGMVQYVNAKLATEQGYQIQGVAFAPLGAGNIFPEGFDSHSIKVRNYKHEGDLVPKVTRQLGDEAIVLPSQDLGYEVKYTQGVGNEIVRYFDDSTSTQHKMVGYMVEVGKLSTRPHNEAELTEISEKQKKNSYLDRTGGGSVLDSLAVTRKILAYNEKTYGANHPHTIATCANYKNQLAEAFPNVSEKDRDKMVIDHGKEMVRSNNVIEGKHPENPNQNIISKIEQSNPIKISEIRSTLNGRMDELIAQEKNLNQERDRVKGDPVTKLQAEKIAASDYLNGADKELAQQRKELQEKQDKLILDEKDIKKYGIENNFDKTLWRHAPNIFKGEGLNYYESSLATLANNSKVFTRQETEIQGKIVQLEKQLQTPEARLYIEKNSQQLVEKDAVRFMKFTTVDSQLSELQQEQNNIIRLRNILPSRRLENEINLQGDGKDVENVLRQANHIKQEVADLKQSMALTSGRSRAM